MGFLSVKKGYHEHSFVSVSAKRWIKGVCILTPHKMIKVFVFQTEQEQCSFFVSHCNCENKALTCISKHDTFFCPQWPNFYHMTRFYHNVSFLEETSFTKTRNNTSRSQLSYNCGFSVVQISKNHEFQNPWQKQQNTNFRALASITRKEMDCF